jgi:hypothetical protein
MTLGTLASGILGTLGLIGWRFRRMRNRQILWIAGPA